MAWQMPEDELSSRRWVIYILSLTMAIGGVLFGLIEMILWLQEAGPLLDVAGGAGLAVLGSCIYFLARRGRLRLAGVLMIALLMLVPAYFLFVEGPKLSGIMIFAVGVVFADLVLGGRAGLVVAALDSLVYLGVGLAYEFGLLSAVSPPFFIADVVAVVLMLLGLTLASGMFTYGMRQAIYQAEEREAALRAADEEGARLLAELQTREEAQRQLLSTVQELASPIMPLAAGVIALPVIGTVDSTRAEQIRAALLRGFVKHRARVAILDITGVAVVDTAVAQALMQTAHGIELLGGRSVLVGIRSEVAQTLVEMGVDLRGIVMQATLQEGLEYARTVVQSWGEGWEEDSAAGRTPGRERVKP
jgi:anti-anti-sigma regulatory factor